MELRQLRYFVTVAEELHFGHAARRLNIVQPAVSQQVRRLERELGVTLLDRSSRRVRLTEPGERLLPEARAVLAAADRTAAVAAGLNAAGTGVFRLGTSPGLSLRLRPGLDALKRLVPAITLELDGRPVAGQLDAVRTGDLDAAVVRAGADSALLDSPDLRAHVLWREPVAVALPAGHDRAAAPHVRLADLAEMPIRFPETRCDPLVREFVLDVCRRAGFEPRAGRPTGSVQDTLVEIGASASVWTLVFDEPVPAALSDQVAIVPVEPTVEIAGVLVTSTTRTPACAEALHNAFGGRTTPAV